MVRKLRRTPKRTSAAAGTRTRTNESTFVLDEAYNEPRFRDFAAEEETPTRVNKKAWVAHAVEAVPVAQDKDASLQLGERNNVDSRVMHEAGIYYAAQQYSRRDGMEARDDIHEEDRSVYQRLSFASNLTNRFSSTGIDDNPQDSESDSGVELENYKYGEEESQRPSHGFLKIISSMFRLRESKRSLTDTTLEWTSFEDSVSEKGAPPEMETIEFMTNHIPQATSTISESSDEGSNLSNLGSDEENDHEDTSSSDEEEDDDLFEDGLFNDYEDGWNDRLLNWICICR